MPYGLCWVLEVAGGKSVCGRSMSPEENSRCPCKDVLGPLRRIWGTCSVLTRPDSTPAQGDKQNKRNTDQARDELKFEKAHYSAC